MPPYVCPHMDIQVRLKLTQQAATNSPHAGPSSWLKGIQMTFAPTILCNHCVCCPSSLLMMRLFTDCWNAALGLSVSLLEEARISRGCWITGKQQAFVFFLFAAEPEGLFVNPAPWFCSTMAQTIKLHTSVLRADVGLWWKHCISFFFFCLSNVPVKKHL